MVDKRRLAAALKAIPPGTRGSIAPQSSGMGRISPVQSEMYYNNPHRGSYGPFMPRQPQVFSDGAFSPMPPTQPVPVDQPPPGADYPDPRWWQYTPGWNLPTPPGTEGLKLASFDQLHTLANRYSVARACIDLREQEIRGLSWEVMLTKEAAKAYQGDHKANRDAGERIAELTKFFHHPDPDFWTFSSFLNAILEDIFVYDALSIIFRPKYGERFGMGGRGLLNSNLDSLRLVAGPTIRPLIDLHGGHPEPPNPAYQQFLYGVPRSDYMTIMRGDDLVNAGMEDAVFNDFTSDRMLYAPYWPVRESPYGQPPVEKALLPIISGLQKQEFQLDYFTEGSVPAVYIDVGDPNMTANQIREFQDAMNGIAGDPAYHLKVVALPAGAKVQPQRPIDLSDSFDELVMEQVCMAFDVQPMELGIIPNIGGGTGGPTASAIRFASQETRDIKSRKSTKPLLQFLQAIFNYVIQDICGQRDLKFQFEGLADDEDKQAITELGVQQVQNAIASIDEVRDRLDLAPWGLEETSGPVVFTAQGPIPLSMAPQLIASMLQQGSQQQGAGGGKKSGKNKGSQGTNSGQRTPSSPSTSKQPRIRRGGQVKPNGSHPAPVTPHREAATPAHSAARGAIQSPGPRTGGTTSRSSVAGSRKKAVMSELDSLKRHLRKDRTIILRWQPKHVQTGDLAKIADDLSAGFLVDAAIDRAVSRWIVRNLVTEENYSPVRQPAEYSHIDHGENITTKAGAQWPGWERDLGLVGAYKNLVGDAFSAAESKGTEIRKRAASGKMFVDNATLRSLVADEIHGEFMNVLPPLWTEAWNLGYEAAKSLVTGGEPNWDVAYTGDALDGFIATEGEHWLDQVTRTGLKNVSSRSEIIARTEVARAMNAAAIQAYRDSSVTHKELALAPDDVCDICKTARDEGVIPLDAVFPGGGLGGPFHPQCRCVPVPAGVTVEPPQGHISKSHPDDDPSMVAFILFRSRDDGKEVYFLQKRGQDMNNPGSWGLPGGTSRHGEEPWKAAVRETQEEIGDFTLTGPAVHFKEKKDGRVVHIFMCDAPEPFAPAMNGATPEETAGWGWFTRSEIKKLDLQPNFKKQWKNIKWDNVAKRVAVTENGEQLVVPDDEHPLFPAGARWPYPRRSDGAEDPHYGTAETPEPPRWDGSEGTNTRVYEDDETVSFPRRRAENDSGADDFPSQGDRRWPDTDTGGAESGVADVGSRTGVPPSGKVTGAPRPVTGSVPPHAGKPVNPHAAVAPEPVDPAQFAPAEDGDETVYFPRPKVKGRGEYQDRAADYSDPSPVSPDTVYLLMSKNFPPAAISWVKRAKWVGPVNIPWSGIDDDDIDSWAASHQPGHVKDFENLIRVHKGHVAPSILVQEPNSHRAFIVDGHHRALAHKNLGQPVLAYLGNIDPEDREAAEETHSKQIHSGSDPKNA